VPVIQMRRLPYTCPGSTNWPFAKGSSRLEFRPLHSGLRGGNSHVPSVGQGARQTIEVDFERGRSLKALLAPETKFDKQD
jgi:hypothetical protein